MSIAAGQLDRRVTIQQRAAGVDTYGQPSTTWETLATVWAWVKAPSGASLAERVAADRQASLVTYSVRIRYRADVTAGMRLLVGSDTWDIDSVVIDHARREYVDLVCVVGGGNGG